jgi:hypothetical protein
MSLATLSDKQFGGSRLAIKYGREIQEDFPEVARMYLDMKMPLEIVEELKLDRLYHINTDIARRAVINALTGCRCKVFGVGYKGLIPTKVMRKIGKEHQIEGARKNGYRCRDQKIGAHALSSEAKSEIGKIVGYMLREKRKGLFDPSRRDEIKRKIADKKGTLVWEARQMLEDRCVYGEAEYAVRLSESKEYRHTRQPYRNKPNWKKISDELNRLYHNGENVRSESVSRRMVRSLESATKHS